MLDKEVCFLIVGIFLNGDEGIDSDSKSLRFATDGDFFGGDFIGVEWELSESESFIRVIGRLRLGGKASLFDFNEGLSVVSTNFILPSGFVIEYGLGSFGKRKDVELLLVKLEGICDVTSKILSWSSLILF